jgi:RNA chaperone Hfq
MLSITTKSEELSEDAFIANCAKGAYLCHIFLANGVRLAGYIVASDLDCIFMCSDNASSPATTLIYKHQVSSVVPIASHPTTADMCELGGILSVPASQR